MTDFASDLVASYYTLTGAGVGQPPRHSLADRAAAAAAAGFTGLALSADELHRARENGGGLADLVATVHGFGLRVPELEPLRGWDDDATAVASRREEEAFYELAAAFGSRRLTVIQVADRDAPVAERFAALCARAAEHGLTICFEPRANSPRSTPAEGWALIDESGAANAGLVLDAYHVHRAGVTVADLQGIPPERIVAVQLNDMLAKPDPDPGIDALQYRLVPGAGVIDLVTWLADLRAFGVSAAFAVEVMSRVANEQPVAGAAQAAADGARAVLDRLDPVSGRH